MLLFTVHPGQEVLETITKLAQLHNIANAAIVSLIGAVDACTIINMDDVDHATLHESEYAQPMDMSGTGEIKADKVHIHCVLSGEGDQAIAGHLVQARVVHNFVNAYVLPMP